jgi:hypothetical protein
MAMVEHGLGVLEQILDRLQRLYITTISYYTTNYYFGRSRNEARVHNPQSPQLVT